MGLGNVALLCERSMSAREGSVRSGAPRASTKEKLKR